MGGNLRLWCHRQRARGNVHTRGSGGVYIGAWKTKETRQIEMLKNFDMRRNRKKRERNDFKVEHTFWIPTTSRKRAAGRRERSRCHEQHAHAKKAHKIVLWSLNDCFRLRIHLVIGARLLCVRERETESRVDLLNASSLIAALTPILFSWLRSSMTPNIKSWLFDLQYIFFLSCRHTTWEAAGWNAKMR